MREPEDLEPAASETQPEKAAIPEDAEELSAAVDYLGITSSQWRLIMLTVALTVGAVLYRVLRGEALDHSAALFLGIPAVVAILLALTPKAKSITGGIVKGITLFLAIVAPLLGEGYLCILIASPLFYLVGIFIGLVADGARRRERRKATLSCVALLIAPMCLEGIVPELTVHRQQTVECARTVNAPAQAVEAALAQSPDIALPLPHFLGIGFPRPLWAHGSGLALGATRTLHFSGAEGDPPGDLVSRVAERRPGYVRMETVRDGTKLTQWVRWQSSEVEWHAVDAAHTAVTWRVHFDRQLDPAWYFVPWERIAVHQAAEYMIEANATPRREAK